MLIWFAINGKIIFLECFYWQIKDSYSSLFEKFTISLLQAMYMPLEYITSKKKNSRLETLYKGGPHNFISLGAPKGHNPALHIISMNGQRKKKQSIWVVKIRGQRLKLEVGFIPAYIFFVLKVKVNFKSYTLGSSKSKPSYKKKKKKRNSWHRTSS